jgi:3-deoxy-D-manno-octulosonic-acid transferase
LLVNLTAKHSDWKLIIAPHEIDTSHIQAIVKKFPEAIKFSDLINNDTENDSLPQVLIIDNIGMLSSLYPYGKMAYIGGGFGAGIHNTLEAAAFGLPVIFGPKYAKFQEAKDLIALNCAKSISSAEELLLAFNAFKNNKEAAKNVKNYVHSKKGASATIIKHLGKFN